MQPFLTEMVTCISEVELKLEKPNISIYTSSEIKTLGSLLNVDKLKFGVFD